MIQVSLERRLEEPFWILDQTQAGRCDNNIDIVTKYVMIHTCQPTENEKWQIRLCDAVVAFQGGPGGMAPPTLENFEINK